MPVTARLPFCDKNTTGLLHAFSPLDALCHVQDNACNRHAKNLPKFQYLNEEDFLKYTLDDGNIVWGEDWDLVFPIEQLHAGVIQ